MRTVLVLAALFPLLSSAADPRNTSDYHVLFDIEAHGKTDLVNGYGAYFQIYEDTGNQWIRYCENFDGHSTSGRPNLKRERMKLIPFGQIDDTAYHCRDFTLADAAIGQPLIAMGNKMFFAMKTETWTAKDGGEFLFQIAQRIPLIGSPTYKTLRIRGTRASSGVLDYVVETLIPRGAALSSHWFAFDVSGSGLGLPNGITGLTINPNEATQQTVDINGLEGPIDVRGSGKSSPAKAF